MHNQRTELLHSMSLSLPLVGWNMPSSGTVTVPTVAFSQKLFLSSLVEFYLTFSLELKIKLEDPCRLLDLLCVDPSSQVICPTNSDHLSLSKFRILCPHFWVITVLFVFPLPALHSRNCQQKETTVAVNITSLFPYLGYYSPRLLIPNFWK